MNAIAITTIIVLAAVAICAVAAAWTAHRRWRQVRRQAHLLVREQQGAERALHKLLHETLPQIHQAGGRISVPVTAPELAGTSVGEQLTTVAKCAADVVQAVVRDIEHATHQKIEQTKTIGAEEIARVRATAVRSTEAAVRSVSSVLVGMAAKTSRKVSEGVREHEDDAAFETLTRIDHTVQQMLLVAQGWTILAGGRLTRHWPTTTLTDVVRASMGYVEDYQRVQPQELTVAVKTRVVGPVVHTLALLLDNALRFSPPQSRVHVFFEQGHHGVTVVVDDSGLQMTSEQLDSARDILTGHRTDDITQLGAHPQTGFRVAAALARIYGFRVDVQAPNSLLGTRALLTLPQDLLTTVPQESPTYTQPMQDAPQAALAPVPDGRLPSLAPVSVSPQPALAPVPAAAEEPDQAVRTTASGLTVRHRRAASASAPGRRPANAEPGRASVIAAWARGTQRARSEQKAPFSTADTDQGHDA